MLLFRVAILISLLVGGESAYTVKPFSTTAVVSASDTQRMITLAKATRLPSGNEFSGGNWSYGIPRDYLDGLRDEWVKTDWHQQLAPLNKFKQYTVKIENVTIHFVHEKSGRPDAIPLIMAHGWPGSVMEYLPMVQYLTKPQMGQRNQTVSYDVIIPSLPGYGFSSLPSASWTIEDTARVFNGLMVDVLGYKTYTLFGSDQGSVVTYDMYTAYPEHVKAAYFVFLPSQAPSLAELAAENITLTPYEQAGAERAAAWSQTGDGYFIEQANQPNTIGQALYDSPVGQLAWIAEKFFVLSDPNNPIANSTVLAHVSLYFLSRSFLSAVWMYTHNSFYRSYASPPTAPMGFSAFKYNPGQWPREFIAQVGNLTVYKEHNFGGHFPGLDNPSVLAADIRELAEFWE